MMESHFLFVVFLPLMLHVSPIQTFGMRANPNVTRLYTPVFQMDDLLNKTFERKVSKDVDMDPCKAGKK
jgi:hypothetical protein